MKTNFKPAYRTAPGFTRADLLVTVLVLGVLGMLNLAAVSNNRAGDQTATCVANLKDLTRAWQQFALDYGYFPPNPDDGNTTPGYGWVPGEVGIGGAQEFNPDILVQPSRSLLFPYLRRADVSVFRCPADLITGRYQGSDPQRRNTIVPVARSYSMNGAIGTDPYSPSKQLAVNDPWLDNNHSHTRGSTWWTYARFDDIIAPSPDKLMLLLDEDEYSINDGVFVFGMQRSEWIDWPGTRHDLSSPLSYTDGHVAVRRWVDPTTLLRNHNPVRTVVPGSPDYAWLSERISARIRPE